MDAQIDNPAEIVEDKKISNAKSKRRQQSRCSIGGQSTWQSSIVLYHKLTLTMKLSSSIPTPGRSRTIFTKAPPQKT